MVMVILLNTLGEESAQFLGVPMKGCSWSYALGREAYAVEHAMWQLQLSVELEFRRSTIQAFHVLCIQASWQRRFPGVRCEQNPLSITSLRYRRSRSYIPGIKAAVPFPLLPTPWCRILRQAFGRDTNE